MPDVTAESGPVPPAARRVLLKLSGEMFGGGAVGLDPIVVRRVAEEIAAAVGQASRSPSSWVAVTSSAARN